MGFRPDSPDADAYGIKMSEPPFHNAIRIDRELDLRGDICPITFVKSKLALEEMSTGQVLRVLVDYAGSVTNVPRSLTHEGHRVLKVQPIAERLWEILVEKVHGE